MDDSQLPKAMLYIRAAEVRATFRRPACEMGTSLQGLTVKWVPAYKDSPACEMGTSLQGLTVKWVPAYKDSLKVTLKRCNNDSPTWGDSYSRKVIVTSDLLCWCITVWGWPHFSTAKKDSSPQGDTTPSTPSSTQL